MRFSTTAFKFNDWFSQAENNKRVAVNRFSGFFFIFNLVLIAVATRYPIGDFGNYYYGCKFFWNGVYPIKYYQDIHFFNTLIRNYEPGFFFENYTPVPPLSLAAYLPFLLFKCSTAKIVFNVFGVIVLTVVLRKILLNYANFSVWFYLIPLVFFQPLFSNFSQGQSYLLILSVSLWFCTSFQKGSNVLPALALAMLFALKIFPAFIVIIPLVKKRWLVVTWALFFVIFLHAVLYFLTGGTVIWYYFSEVLPRLAGNNVTEPFSFFNQSFHSLFLKIFVHNWHLNASPPVNAAYVAVALQVLLYAFVFYFLIVALKSAKALPALGFTFLAMSLINKYSTVYGLLLLMPVFYLLETMPKKNALAIIFMLLIACNLPIHKLQGLPVIFQYSRLWILCLVFLVLWFTYVHEFRFKMILILSVVFFIPSLDFYRYKTTHVIELRSTRGVVYDYELRNSQIRLLTCLGNHDSLESTYLRGITDTVHFNDPRWKERVDTILKNENAQVKNPMIIHNRWLIFLTDRNAGVGMYYLKLIDLR